MNAIKIILRGLARILHDLHEHNRRRRQWEKLWPRRNNCWR